MKISLILTTLVLCLGCNRDMGICTVTDKQPVGGFMSPSIIMSFKCGEIRVASSSPTCFPYSTGDSVRIINSLGEKLCRDSK